MTVPRPWTLRTRALTATLLALAVGLGPALPAAAGDITPDDCLTSADPGRARPVRGASFMVATAHPLATLVGCEVLRNRGTAADAAVAVQAMLTVVEPQSSGFGGGSLIMHWNAGEKSLRFYEGLAQAPSRVTAGLRVPTEQEQRRYLVEEFTHDVDFTGRAVGVPGTVRALDQLHTEYGSKTWVSLLDPAVRTATDGFAVSPYLHDVTDGLCRYPDIRRRYCDGDQPKPVGATVVNRELADTLWDISLGRSDAFHDPEGSIAPAIVARASAGTFKPRADAGGPAVIPSLLTVEDIARYQARERAPLCGTAVGHRVCTAGPPAFGGLALLELLELADRHRVSGREPEQLDHTHLLLEASRLAGVDARAYVGDPEADAVPLAALRDPAYLARRAGLIRLDSSVHPVRPGLPLSQLGSPGDKDATSHVSIVDRYGNAVSMTSTVNLGFGSRLEAAGLILNNVQSNFSEPDAAFNAMEPGKRPTTSTAPTLVFDSGGRLRLVAGSAGGGPIPDYVAQTVLGVLGHGLDPQAALNAPHVTGYAMTPHCDGELDARSELEEATAVERLLAGLRRRGHPCARAAVLRSGGTAVEVAPGGGLLGAADRRRDGTAMGL